MKNNYLILSMYLLGLWWSIMPVYGVDNTVPYTIVSNTINKSERDDRNYQVIQLENQMKVLLISDPSAVKSLASLALPVGSLQDPMSQQGLAHYTEHMVLMGSKKYPQPSSFSEYLTQHAGSYNASTAKYRTTFYFEVENSAFDGAVDRLADAIEAPLLNPSNADKERHAVDAELTMARANDGFRIGQVDAETINPKHPAAMFSGGNLETLSDKPNSVLQQELAKFHQNNYSANIMVGVLYSDQPLNQLAQLAVDTFGRIVNKDITVKPITEVALTPDTLGKWIYMQPAQPKKMLYIQFPMENDLTKFADKTDEYIGYMISNRSPDTLFDKLQKKGLIESISSSSDPIRYGNSGIFGIYVNLTDKGSAMRNEVIADIFAYLSLLSKQGISQDYYDEIKKVLQLQFKYPDITRDMSYVEWLSSQMLFYPTEHILDSDYVATNFNPQAIAARLKGLTPENARIWVIAPNEQTDKLAYFVNAPYHIEDITAGDLKHLHALIHNHDFSLPLINPYIVDNFELVTQSNDKRAQDDTFNASGNHMHFSSQYFANEPKAAIILSLRNNWAFDSAKRQVMFSLLDYIVSRELATLDFQANVAGVDLSTSADSGLSITLSGFNQHLDEMLVEILATYHNALIDKNTLELAKSWYLEKLAAADYANSYSLALQPINALSSIPYFERETKKSLVEAITPAQLVQYRQQLLFDSVPYMFSLGNLSYEQSAKMYQDIRQTLNEKSQYQKNQTIKIAYKSDAIISKNTQTTDNALLMAFVPKGYDKITSQITSYLLYKIISPWFYDQLRSQEQLGYAVFSPPIAVGDSTGIGFLIQSNQYDPAYLNERYQAFYPIILDKLNALTDEQFAQYRQATIDELSLPPQTLDEEFSDYLGDYYQSLFDFKSKQQRIVRLSKLTKTELIEFYRQAVMAPNGLVIASEVLGQQPDKTMKAVSGLTPYQGAKALQDKLLQD